MSVPCHEGPPATRGHFCSEPAVAGGGRYYCITIVSYKLFYSNAVHKFPVYGTIKCYGIVCVQQRNSDICAPINYIDKDIF